MSAFTEARDKFTGAAGGLLSGAVGGLGGLLTGGLGGLAGIGGLGGMLGGMQGQPQMNQMGGFGGFGGFMGQMGTGLHGDNSSLYELLNQKYGQQQISPTGNSNLSNQGLI